jgi:dihydrofolate synthase/folylpolyglutamate synthase
MSKPGIQQYLEGLGRFGMNFGLGRTRTLLDELDDPHLAYPAVHVTGTNGKGSVCKMLSCILQEAGFRTGLYVSPHLERFNERISVDGVDIPDQDLERIGSKVKALVEKMAGGGKARQCTYFEATTALAFDYFRKAKVDIAVIEVGLGGRLDATNVIDPLVSVITNVTLEHTDVLGKTIEKIAREKAGIIKPGRPLVTGALDKNAFDVIQSTARKKNAPFHMMQREVRRRPKSWDLKGQTFGIYTDREAYRELFSPMLGAFQLQNAAMAVLTSEVLAEEGLKIDAEHIRKGIAAARLPGRMEILGSKPQIILDSAHNPDAARNAASEMAMLKKKAGWERTHLVFGILGDKDLANVLGPMLEEADTLTYTQPSTDRALAIEKARKRLEALTKGKGLSIVSRPQNALHAVLKNAGKNDVIWVTGSMYLVGEVRGLLRKRGIIKE